MGTDLSFKPLILGPFHRGGLLDDDIDRGGNIESSAFEMKRNQSISPAGRNSGLINAQQKCLGASKQNIAAGKTSPPELGVTTYVPVQTNMIALITPHPL